MKNENKNIDISKLLKEGYVKKGGINPPSDTPRPKVKPVGQSPKK